eukprot:EG_transcript_25164
MAGKGPCGPPVQVESDYTIAIDDIIAEGDCEYPSCGPEPGAVSPSSAPACRPDPEESEQTHSKPAAAEERELHQLQAKLRPDEWDKKQDAERNKKQAEDEEREMRKKQLTLASSSNAPLPSLPPSPLSQHPDQIPALSAGLVVPASSAGLVVPASSAGLVVPTSSVGWGVPASFAGLVVPTSTGFVVPSASDGFPNFSNVPPCVGPSLGSAPVPAMSPASLLPPPAQQNAHALPL